MNSEFLTLIKICCTQISHIFPFHESQMDHVNWNVLLTHLRDQKIPAGMTFKKAGEVERQSRLLLQGLVVAFDDARAHDSKIYRVYEAGDVVVDLDSLKSGKPATLRFLAYTPARMALLDRRQEKVLLQNHPEFNPLSTLINQYMYSREVAFSKILSLPNQERYHSFMNQYKLAAKHLKIKDIAELLNFSTSTIKRIRKQKE